MIYRLETALRSLRRTFSRNRLLVWLFGMSKSSEPKNSLGLIMLQIDGLSEVQFKRALDNGSMPFTKKLLDREHYQLRTLYSGMPSSTPAAHGELFYGVKGCVPAFRFKRPQDKTPKIMLDSDLAADIQQTLEAQGEPLLKGGSVHSDMFDGGADEASFCASSLGWSNLVPTRDTYKMLIFILLNMVSVFRVVLLSLLELMLATVDLVRGVLVGQNLFKEILFVPIRITTAVLLRELVTIGISLDAARGLRIIHGNFLGYDEQAHRRGPESNFAHWSLKGIDRAIAKIWKAAKQSEYRDYDFIVHSDHGQEQTLNYPEEFGRSIHDAVNAVLLNFVESPSATSRAVNTEGADDDNFKHVHLLGSKKINKWITRLSSKEYEEVSIDFSLAAMGPLGFIYLDQPLNDETKVAIAERLLSDANVPMIVTLLEKDKAQHEASVWTEHGRYHLPEDKQTVFGANHPFLDEVCDDFIALCHHGYAGEFILSGWSSSSPAMSLRIENGAHAGPGPNETNAFVLLPEDLQISSEALRKGYLRFLDLYNAVDNHLGRVGSDRQSMNLEAEGFSVPERSPNSLRVMTYNVHSCIGMDGHVSPRRIARVIALYQPDIVAIQELNSGALNSSHHEQISTIAEELDMHIEFHPIKDVANGQVGNAVLSRFPMSLVSTSKLPNNTKVLRPRHTSLEQDRGVMDVEVDYQGHRLRIVNTHLGLTPEERKLQVTELLSAPRFDADQTPTIICGDFNATHKQKAHRKISALMPDVEQKFQQGKPPKTFPGRFPALRLDHIFIDKQIAVRNVIVPNNHLTKVASDHLPLIADLDLASYQA